MSPSEEFRQYAEEALQSASQSKNETERLGLIDLAHTWALAAFKSDQATKRALAI